MNAQKANSNEVRIALYKALPTDSDFTAFVLDYFPEIYRRISNGMDRLAKENLLLTLAETASVIESLNHYCNNNLIFKSSNVVKFDIKNNLRFSNRKINRKIFPWSNMATHLGALTIAILTILVLSWKFLSWQSFIFHSTNRTSTYPEDLSRAVTSQSVLMSEKRPEKAYIYIIDKVSVSSEELKPETSKTGARKNAKHKTTNTHHISVDDLADELSKPSSLE